MMSDRFEKKYSQSQSSTRLQFNKPPSTQQTQRVPTIITTYLPKTKPKLQNILIPLTPSEQKTSYFTSKNKTFSSKGFKSGDQNFWKIYDETEIEQQPIKDMSTLGLINFCNKNELDKIHLERIVAHKYEQLNFDLDEIKEKKIQSAQGQRLIFQSVKTPKSQRFFQKNIPTINFSLKQLDNTHQVVSKTELHLNRNKIENQQNSPDYFDFEEEDFTLRKPCFHKYFIKTKSIRNFDMIYNVNHLVRLQEFRETQMLTKQPDAQLQHEIMRRKNHINYLKSEVKNVNQMKNATGMFYNQSLKNDKNVEDVCTQINKVFNRH